MNVVMMGGIMAKGATKQKPVDIEGAADNLHQLYGLTENIIDIIESGEVYNAAAYVPHLEQLVNAVESAVETLTEELQVVNESKDKMLGNTRKIRVQKTLNTLLQAIDKFQHAHNALA